VERNDRHLGSALNRKAIKIIVGVIVIAVVLALLLPAIYGVFNRAPESLVTNRFTDGTTILANELDGTWLVTDGSIVGYRVPERIGLTTLEGVGRTSAVTGTFVVDDGTLEAATFEVDMATFTSDRSQRDDQFRGRIMDVATYPTATFQLLTPSEIPDSTTVASMEPFVVSGNLTLRGVTNEVTVQIFAAIDEGQLRLTGSTEIIFSEWGIPNPSLPAALIFTEDRGTLEFDLLFQPTE
jgi:polyisoprenoid-binding protein YceI